MLGTKNNISGTDDNIFGYGSHIFGTENSISATESDIFDQNTAFYQNTVLKQIVRLAGPDLFRQPYCGSTK